MQRLYIQLYSYVFVTGFVKLTYSLSPSSVVEVGFLSFVLPTPGRGAVRWCSALQVVSIFIPIVCCF